MSGQAEAFFGPFDVGFDLGELVLGDDQLAAEFGLLLFEDVERDRPRVGEMVRNELSAAPLQVRHGVSVAGRLALAIVGHAAELLDQLGLKLGDSVRVELDLRQVILGHGVLDLVRGQIGQGAGSVGMPAPADEVIVLAAAAAGDLGEDQPPTARAAVDGAFEVVAVLPLPLGGDGVGGEPLLDRFEEFGVDEGRVVPRVLDALEGDGADVVGVAQHLVDGRLVDLPRRPLRRRPGAQPAVVEFFGQRAERPVAGGVGGERPLDVRCSFRVDFDVADVVGAVPAALVEVPERDAVRRAAHARFLDASLGDLLGIVTGAVGVDGGHDAEGEHSLRRRAVDAFHHRDKLRAS